MANREHIAILSQGITCWNSWRMQNEDIFPDLEGADLECANLQGANLEGANLQNANLFAANLIGANLSWADLRRANLFESRMIRTNFYRANLNRAVLVNADLRGSYFGRARMSRANLSKANLTACNMDHANLQGAILFGARMVKANLKGVNFKKAQLRGVNVSGSVLDEETTFYRTRDIVPGMNGMYSTYSNSTAFMKPRVQGDSMLANDPRAVLNSLTTARRYHTLSIAFALVALGVSIIFRPQQDLSSFALLNTIFERFATFAMLLTGACLYFVKSYMEDALAGVRFLRSRASAMKVGKFPWPLSRYMGTTTNKKVATTLSRVVLCFHPLVYLLIPFSPESWYNWILLAGVLAMSALTLKVSMEFQRPILFDPLTEMKQQRQKKKTQQTINLVAKQLKAQNLQKALPPSRHLN